MIVLLLGLAQAASLDLPASPAAAPAAGEPFSAKPGSFAVTSLSDYSNCDTQAALTRLASYQAVLKKTQAADTWYQVKVGERAPVFELGLDPLLSSLLLGPPLQFTATKAEMAVQVDPKDKWATKRWVSNTKVLWADEAKTRPAAVYLWDKESGYERGPWERRSERLVVFDTSARVEAVFSVTTYGDDGHRDELFVYQRDAAGLVEGADHVFYDRGDSKWRDEHTPTCTTDKIRVEG